MFNIYVYTNIFINEISTVKIEVTEELVAPYIFRWVVKKIDLMAFASGLK